MPIPEEQAQEIIDQKLITAGWTVQDFKQLNLGAGPGAVRAAAAVDIEAGVCGTVGVVFKERKCVILFLLKV